AVGTPALPGYQRQSPWLALSRADIGADALPRDHTWLATLCFGGLQGRRDGERRRQHAQHEPLARELVESLPVRADGGRNGVPDALMHEVTILLVHTVWTEV